MPKETHEDPKKTMTPVDCYHRLLTIFLQCVQTSPTRRPQDFSRCRPLPLARRIVVLLSLVASGRDNGVETQRRECCTLARRRGLGPEGQRPQRRALTTARAKRPWQAFDAFLGHAVT